MEGPGSREQHFVLAGLGQQPVNATRRLVQGGHATVRVRAFADLTCDDDDAAAAAACKLPGLRCGGHALAHSSPQTALIWPAHTPAAPRHVPLRSEWSLITFTGELCS